MKVAVLLEQRRKNWLELDRLCDQVRRRNHEAELVVRFASLYRAACADLALADAYQLPPGTVQYLHQLVGRAHNQLYRSRRRLDLTRLGRTLLVDVPRRIFRDRCVQIALLLFWGTFLGSGAMAYFDADWGLQVTPPGMIEMLEDSFDEPLSMRDPQANFAMAGFYIQHNTTIGLRCFASGILIVPGLYETLYNALVLGACFGYMARPGVAAGGNFYEFVTAHGPFELTAIALAAGAGLRLGLGWINTGGLTRAASLRKTATDTVPLMGVSGALFFLAALIEGFFSPLPLPYAVKASVAVVTGVILFLYIVVLGFPRRVR